MARKTATGEPERDVRAAVMSLGEHLEELRARLIKCLLALGAALAVCWVLRLRLQAIIERPHVLAMRAMGMDSALKFQSYFEPLMAQLRICAIVGAVLAAPVIIYQVWAFVAPGLFPRERSKAVRLGAACLGCFAAGIAAGYFAFVPLTLRVLVSLAGPNVEPMLMIGRYVNLFFLLTFTMGVAFQTPVVVYHLIRWGILSAEGLDRHRKPVILGAFILGAVLTPTVDPFTQTAVAALLIFLYDVGGLVAAPNWRGLARFLRFSGIVLLAAVAVWAWLEFWPVASVTARSGAVHVGNQTAGPGQTLKMRRGALCRTEDGALADVALGGREGAVVHLAGNAQFQVTGRGKAGLYRGECLVDSPGKNRPVEVHAGPAALVIAGATAELAAPDADAVTVTVFKGTVECNVGGRREEVLAGRAATFRRGGEPVSLSDAERRWQQRIEPAGGAHGTVP
jgi:sec-independent protein translocase protein TatC